ncbi:MAG TPA: hypothetical protein VF121_15395 [Thermoanaerobaculia bacterium]|nr:hypothetical protein [Thermoanaerobaculia bacterium]
MIAGSLPGLLGVALFAAAGAGLAELAPALRRLPLPRRLAYAYLLGVCWVGGALYAASHLFALPLRRPAILALAAAPILGGALARWRRRPRAVVVPARRRSALDTATAAVVACVSLAVFAQALSEPLDDWDGRMTWSTQAAYLRHEGTVLPTALARGRWFVTHPQYPLLLPLGQVAVQELAGAGRDEQPFRALYAAFYPVLLLVVWDGARRRAGARAAALAVLAVAPVPLLSFVGEGRATGAYSDLPLACLYGAGLLLLLRPRLRPLDGLAAGLLLAGAALAKNEGAFLAAAALLLAALARAGPFRRLRTSRGRHRLARRLAPVAAATVPVVAALLLLASWRAGVPNRHDEGYAALLDPVRLPVEAVARLPVLVPIALERTFLSATWGTYWWMGVVVLAAGWRGARRRRGAVLAWAAAAPLAVGWLAYSVHWAPAYVAGVTWERLLLQGLVPAAVLLAAALRGCLARAAT